MDEDISRFRSSKRNKKSEIDYRFQLQEHFNDCNGSVYEKLENFTNHISRQSTARFLALYEIYKLILPIHGSIIECGVNWGGGLMTFAQISECLEPVNFQRKIIGFDTFEGFPELNKIDVETSVGDASVVKKGGFAANSYDDLNRTIEIFNSNRLIKHIPKISLVKGDATVTMPKFLNKHPETIVSLLHLDFDIYDPTLVAIKTFLPRMPKGAVIIFDELNNATWPGETKAVLESLDINTLEIRRFEFEPHVSYAVIG